MSLLGPSLAPLAEQTAGPTPFLELRGVTKLYAQQTVLAPIDLDIRQGEFFTLLGPSGCGKTTLLRIIAGLETSTAGTIRLGPLDLLATPPERRPVNLVFQNYALFPHMTVAENVAYGLHAERRPLEEIRRRVADALDLVGLTDKAESDVTQLSGGQQQRVALTRALVKRPQLLLLDEPLAALDLQLRKRLQHELRTLQAELGTTFIFVTHDQEEAFALSHRIALMEEGRIQQLGTPQEIYDQPANRFVAEFVGESNLLACEVQQRCGDRCTVQLRGGQIVTARCADQVPAVSTSALLALRPEHLRLTTDDSALLRATAGLATFRGADAVLEVDVPEAGVLTVCVAADEVPPIGTPVGVHILPERGWLLGSD